MAGAGEVGRHRRRVDERLDRRCCGRRRRCRWSCRALASTETVNAVRWASVFWRRPSTAARARRDARALIGTQISPRCARRKNAIFSGVANSAAMTRSPSFSRSSSSTTTTISPRPIAAIASSMLAIGTSVTASLSPLSLPAPELRPNSQRQVRARSPVRYRSARRFRAGAPTADGRARHRPWSATPGPAKTGRPSSPPSSTGARYHTYRFTRPSRWKLGDIGPTFDQELHDSSPAEVVQNGAEFTVDLEGGKDAGAGGDPAKHNAKRLAPELLLALPLLRAPICVVGTNGELRVVGSHGPGPDEHGIALGAQAVDVAPRLGTRDPPARAVRCHDPPVERHGELEHDEGSAGRAVHEVRVELFRTTSASTPVVTETPAASRALNPAPATTGSGSPIPATTLATPAATIASVHGGVRP